MRTIHRVTAASGAALLALATGLTASAATTPEAASS